ncbi:MAG: DNA primase [Flavobacteriaceae bacterium]|jgi:DNA primase|nr:DNA primase [Flavobacteriaceae bacterium]
MISKNTIDNVYERSRVEEVIGDFISLKKSGTNYKGLSPFTQERTPSFMVSPVKQIWKDFSSGKGGNVVAFLMEHEHFTYPEAIKYLAKKYNIEIEETIQTDESKRLESQRESMFLVVNFASNFFHETLLNTSEGKNIAKTYFSERGISDKSIKDFSLGFSPEKDDSFALHALKNEYNKDFLDKTGLVIYNKNKGIDRFRGRIIFPIKSISGRIQGFGARLISEKSKKPKYLNSIESEIYQKSKILYGIYESKQAIAKNDLCYLVEGYTDVIQLHQSNIKNVVSSSGTALSIDQIRMIGRLTSNIVVLFDGDDAGLRASLRGIDLILEQEMNVKICVFPKGEDPDSYARNHTEDQIVDFLQKQTKDFIQFKASLLADNNVSDPIKKAETTKEIIHSISKIPDLVKQEIYIQSCSEIMNISEETLFASLEQLKQKKDKPAFRRSAQSFSLDKRVAYPSEKIDKAYELEKQIISILIHYGNYDANFDEIILRSSEKGELIEDIKKISLKVYEKIFLDLQQDEVELTNDSFRKIFNKLLESYQVKKSNDYGIEELMKDNDINLNKVITDILIDDERYYLHNWEKKNIFVKNKVNQISRYVDETILNLRRYLIDQKIEELQLKVRESEDNKDLLEEILSYSQLKKVLSERLNRVL